MDRPSVKCRPIRGSSRAEANDDRVKYYPDDHYILPDRLSAAPTTHPQISARSSVKSGDSGAVFTTSEIARRPPARDTRKASRNTYVLSGARLMTQFHKTTSAVASGFTNIRVVVKPQSRAMIVTWAPGRGVENFVASATIEGCKPSLDSGYDK